MNAHIITLLKSIKVILSFFLVYIFMCILFLPKLNAQDFTNFSIDIPSNWNIKEEKPTLTFTEPMGMCSINVSITPSQGASYNELAILLYQSLQGKNPKNDDNGFSFFIDTKSDIISVARFTEHKDKIIFVVASGACVSFQNIVQSLSVAGTSIRAYPILSSEQSLTAP